MEVKMNKYISNSPVQTRGVNMPRPLISHKINLMDGCLLFKPATLVLPQSWPQSRPQSSFGVIQAICLLFICCSVLLPR